MAWEIATVASSNKVLPDFKLQLSPFNSSCPILAILAREWYQNLRHLIYGVRYFGRINGKSITEDLSRVFLEDWAVNGHHSTYLGLGFHALLADTQLHFTERMWQNKEGGRCLLISQNPCLWRFLGIIGQDPTVSKCNRLRVDIFLFFFR